MKAKLLLFCMIGVFSLVLAEESQVQRSDANFPDRMRQLMDNQVTWTRLYVVSVGGGLPDTAYARVRLFRCAEDMGQAVEAYFGRSVADTVARELKRHLELLAGFVRAVKLDEPQAIESSRKAWLAQAESALARLGQEAKSIKPPVDKYLKQTDREVISRAVGDYPNDTANFGELQETALQIADATAAAILRLAKLRSK